MDPAPGSRCRAVLCDLDDTLFDHRHALAVEGDGDDGEIIAAAGRLQAIEGRHLAYAGRAPGGPQVEDHDLAGKTVPIGDPTTSAIEEILA